MVLQNAPALDESLMSLTKSERAFFQTSISDDEAALRERVLRVQKRAYEYYAYPCIYLFHFLGLFMQENEIYQRVVDAGKCGGTSFLDIGCCMGTDVRKLVSSGYPATHVFAVDLHQEFIDCGYELFQDADTCKIRFFVKNIFDLQLPAASVSVKKDLQSVTRFEELTGQITHCYLGALFHMFDEETQYDLAKRVATIVKTAPGTVIFGRHEASPDVPKMLSDLNMPSMAGRFGHTTDTWKALWTKVFTEKESEQFVREHVVVKTEITNNWGRAEIINTLPDWTLMYWSVEIV